MAFEKNDTYQKVVQAIAEKLAINNADIKPDSTLQSLGADSLDLVELVMRFEEMFGIEINDDEAEHFKHVQDVVDYLHEQRKR